jgi:hypothetical protein
MLFIPERRRSGRAQRRDPRRDVRAADLQEERTKRVPKQSCLSEPSFRGFDEDGGSTANIAASEASH